MWNIIWTIMALMVIVLLWVMLFDSNRFVVRKVNIEDGRIRKNFRVAVLSDLHDKQYGKKNALLLKAIEENKVDAIFVAGDMITATPNHNPEKTLLFLEELSSKYPICYGVGNHEYRYKLYPKKYGDIPNMFRERLTKMNLPLMENEGKYFDEWNVKVVGLEIDRRFYQRFKAPAMEKEYLPSILGEVSEEEYTILLAHNPDYFEEYALWGADLVLSGHVHGGMVRIPGGKGVVSPKVSFFPKYDGGIFENGKSKMILSRGLGMHTIPIRLFNPGELIIIDFSNKNRYNT